MGKIIGKYIQYGVPSDLADKYDQFNLPITTFRTLSIEKLGQFYSIAKEEAKLVKRYIQRQPIDFSTLQELLYNNNYTCCCCKGVKSDAYIIHHIEEYEISRNNSYDNLAVLCPNDHDLAHRPPRLTNKINSDHIRLSKLNWEKEVKLNNIIASQHGERQDLIFKIPKFRELSEEIKNLQSQLNDKEKIIARSDAYFESERNNLYEKIAELTSQIDFMEQQVVNTARNILNSNSLSFVFSDAISFFLDGNIDKAIEVLNKTDLDQELNEIEEIERKNNIKLKENADARILRAQLFLLNINIAEAFESAGQGLKIYEKLADCDTETYLPQLVNCFEKVGTIYYNLGLFEESEACFVSGINICRHLEEKGDYSQFPLYALLLQNVGASYYSRNDYRTSVSILEEARMMFNLLQEMLEKYQDSYQISPTMIDFQRALVTSNLGMSYKNLNADDPRALDMLLESLRIYERLVKENLSNEKCQGYVIVLKGLASLYFQKGEIEAANNFYNLALSESRKLVLKNRIYYINGLADLLLDIVAIHVQSGKLQESEIYCDEAIQIYRQIGIMKKMKRNYPQHYCINV
ncbi:HNH endonuclease [Bacillus sp. Bva_UNVM-123]|uniref:HNH endonuclease n=1 Tax=Bacillus sp. Bva_UNVM-123 TaxID=2829798 RepID=UPI00391F7E7B